MGRREEEISALGLWVDGGYCENSGSATLAAMMREITRKDPENARRLVLITISHDPSDGVTDHVCKDERVHQDADKSRKPLTQSRTEKDKKGSLGSVGPDAQRSALLPVEL
jgi:hypothetical protein